MIIYIVIAGIFYLLIGLAVSAWFYSNEITLLYDDDEEIIKTCLVCLFWPVYGLYKLLQVIFYIFVSLFS